MKKILFFTLFLIISLVLTGCFHAPKTPVKVKQTPTPQAPSFTDIDENDYLDDALKELDEVE